MLVDEREADELGRRARAGPDARRAARRRACSSRAGTCAATTRRTRSSTPARTARARCLRRPAHRDRQHARHRLLALSALATLQAPAAGLAARPPRGEGLAPRSRSRTAADLDVGRGTARSTTSRGLWGAAGTHRRAADIERSGGRRIADRSAREIDDLPFVRRLADGTLPGGLPVLPRAGRALPARATRACSPGEPARADAGGAGFWAESRAAHADRRSRAARLVAVPEPAPLAGAGHATAYLDHLRARRARRRPRGARRGAAAVLLALRRPRRRLRAARSEPRRRPTRTRTRPGWRRTRIRCSPPPAVARASWSRVPPRARTPPPALGCGRRSSAPPSTSGGSSPRPISADDPLAMVFP